MSGEIVLTDDVSESQNWTFHVLYRNKTLIFTLTGEGVENKSIHMTCDYLEQTNLNQDLIQ